MEKIDMEKYLGGLDDIQKEEFADIVERELPVFLDAAVKKVGPAAEQRRLMADFQKEYDATPNGAVEMIYRLRIKYRKLGLKGI